MRRFLANMENMDIRGAARMAMREIHNRRPQQAGQRCQGSAAFANFDGCNPTLSVSLIPYLSALTLAHSLFKPNGHCLNKSPPSY
jgi:hypothetical protein